MRRHQFTRGSLVIIKLRELAVALRVVISGINDHLALKAVRGQRFEFAKGNSNQHEFPKIRSLLNRGRFCVSAELCNHHFQTFTAARVTERNFMSGTHKQPRRVCANVSGTDNPYFHLRLPFLELLRSVYSWL